MWDFVYSVLWLSLTSWNVDRLSSDRGRGCIHWRGCIHGGGEVVHNLEEWKRGASTEWGGASSRVASWWVHTGDASRRGLHSLEGLHPLEEGGASTGGGNIHWGRIQGCASWMHPLWKEWHILVKTLPSPILCMRSVMNSTLLSEQGCVHRGVTDRWCIKTVAYNPTDQF